MRAAGQPPGRPGSWPGPPFIVSRSRAARTATAAVLPGRAAGSFAVSSVTSAVTGAGTAAGSGGSDPYRLAAANSKGVPWNGVLPVRHS